MKTVNHLIGILDILLGAGALAALVAFLVRLRKTAKAAEPLTGSLNIMNGELNAVKSKTGKIKESAPSYKFFASLFIILTIIKEAIRSWWNDGSLPGSFTGAYLRHSRQLNRFRK